MTTILYSYRFALSTDIDIIIKGILEILFLEEEKTSFFSEEKHKEQLNLISEAIDKNDYLYHPLNQQHRHHPLILLF